MSANDIQAIDDLMTLISDARQSIQDAHFIAHIVGQLKNHEKDPESRRYGEAEICSDP